MRSKAHNLIVITVILCSVLAIAFEAEGQVTNPPASRDKWESIYKNIRAKYVNYDKKYEAVNDMKTAILDNGNNYSEAVLIGLLGILSEFYDRGQPGSPKAFKDIIYGMFKKSVPSRIEGIVEYFRSTPKLYDFASETKREYYTPVTARLELDNKTLDIGDTAQLSIKAWNKEKERVYDLRKLFTLGIKDETIAELEKSSKMVVGRSDGETFIILENNQGIPYDSVKLTVQPGQDLRLVPETQRLTVGETKQFTIKSNKELEDGTVVIRIEPPSAAALKVITPSPGSTEQHISVTGRIASHNAAELRVSVQDDYTFASIFIIPPEPTVPSKKNMLIGGGVTLGLLYSTIGLQGDANTKRDAEELAGKTSGVGAQELEELHTEYRSAQQKATLFWVFSGASASITLYLYLKHRTDLNKYNIRLKEFEEYGVLGVGLDQRGYVQLSFKF